MSLKSVAPVVLTMGLLGGALHQKMDFLSADDAVAYHQRVAAAVGSLPKQFGPWVGRDIDMPPGALALLRPNAISSRRYEHQTTGQQVQFLIVQCTDAREMLGHYPPNCYPAQGWTLRTEQPAVWSAPDLEVPGMTYEFFQVLPTRSSMVHVSNVIILPDGQMVRDMRAVQELGADYWKHHYGAAQIQMVFGADAAAAQREEIFETFLGVVAAVVEVIRSGVER